jgi:ribosomal protein L16/L10AE
MLSPRTKFRRHHRGNRKGKLVEETLLFWRFWFTGLRTRWIKSRQIESGRRINSLCS